MSTADDLGLQVGEVVRIGRAVYTTSSLVVHGETIPVLRHEGLVYEDCPRVRILSRSTSGTTVEYLDDCVALMDGEPVPTHLFYSDRSGATKHIHSGFIGFFRDEQEQPDISDKISDA